MGQVRSGAIAEQRAEMIVAAVILTLFAVGVLALSQAGAGRLIPRAIVLALGAAGLAVLCIIGSFRPARLTYGAAGLTVWTGRRKDMTLPWERVECFFVDRHPDAGEQVGWVRRRETGDFIVRLPDGNDELAGRLSSNFGLTADKLSRVLNARLAESRAP